MLQSLCNNTKKVFSLFIFLFALRLSSVQLSSVVVAQEKIKIVGTTNIISATLKELAGDVPEFEIKSLMGEGIDPHLYRPAPGDLNLLLSADIVFYNGLHLEGKMADILENLAKKRKVIGLGDLLDKAKLREAKEFSGNHDPHIWFDILLWRDVAKIITDELIKLAPAKTETLNQKFEKFEKKSLELHEKIKSEFQKIPKEKRVLVTAHDAFGYFGRAYDLEVRGIQGLSTDSETSLLGMNTIVDFIIERKVPSIFVESSVPQKAVQALVEISRDKGHTLKIGKELYSDALGAEGTKEGTYLGMIEHNFSAIAEGLRANS